MVRDPQGSLLGSYLFGLYISSLQPCLPTTCLLKYVDDVCIIMRIGKDTVHEDLANIGYELDNIITWSISNKLMLNNEKTKGIVHYCGHFKNCCDVEASLPMVNFDTSLRFLGIQIDNSLKWKSHVNFILKKCAQRIYILRRIKSVTSKSEFITIYNGLIRSLME